MPASAKPLVLELYGALLQDRQARRATGMSVQPAR